MPQHSMPQTMVSDIMVCLATIYVALVYTYQHVVHKSPVINPPMAGPPAPRPAARRIFILRTSTRRQIVRVIGRYSGSAEVRTPAADHRGVGCPAGLWQWENMDGI